MMKEVECRCVQDGILGFHPHNGWTDNDFDMDGQCQHRSVTDFVTLNIVETFCRREVNGGLVDEIECTTTAGSKDLLHVQDAGQTRT